MAWRPRVATGALTVVLVAVGLVAAAIGSNKSAPRVPVTPNLQIAGGNISHVIIIMQENRSFDSYFGAYPGADGDVDSNGNPLPNTCISDPADGSSVCPYSSKSDISYQSKHQESAAVTDINGGRMDGFISVARQENTVPAAHDSDPQTPLNAAKQVMGYHTGATSTDQLYSYWQMAQQYVLQDHLFEAVPSWSNPSHDYLVSGWSASYAPGTSASTCVTTTTVTSPVCQTNLDDPLDQAVANHTYAGWHSLAAELTNQLGSASWAFFSAPPPPPPGTDASLTTPAIWKPLLNGVGTLTQSGFADVKHDKAPNGKSSADQYYPADFKSYLDACKPVTGDCTTFPNVSWIVPSVVNSEHPPNSIFAGESYVTKLVNQIGDVPSLWNHVAIFLSWDDWGGFYDHVVPPPVPKSASDKGDIGYGLRVPGLIISPYACTGTIDNQNSDHDSYLKFIEDDLLSQARIPMDDGRPDQRDAMAGDLTGDFCTSTPRTFTNIPPPPAPASPSSVSAAEEATMLANLRD
jgi:phospholipase C